MMQKAWRVYVSYPETPSPFAYLQHSHLSWRYALHMAIEEARRSGLKYHVRKNTGDTYIKVDK